jgi:uncharacterized protein (TIGR03083 family)
MRLAQDERTDLADFLAGLAAEQWDAPTLCTRWRVREVVAHVISYDDLGPLGLVGRFARGWFVPDRVSEVGVRRYAALSTDELLAELKDHLRPAGLTAAFGGRLGLCDGLIHHQDIRRPLGRPREIPAERLVPALRTALTAPVIRGFWRVRGLRLVATDLDWSTGRGPEVRGTAEALLMVIAGRRGVVGELSGPGQAKLAERVGG